MFSDLPIQTIKELSSDIGINVDQISFGTFDMIKVVVSEQNDDDLAEADKDMNEKLIEWLQDEPSETECKILALSKKKGKLSKRKLKISPNSKSKTHVQEAPGLKRKGKGGKVGLQTPKLKKKKGKKMTVHGLIWNCRGLKKNGVSTFLKSLIFQYNFDFIGLQETMVEECEVSLLRKFDTHQDYLWEWIPSKGRSGGILVGICLNKYDVGSFMKGIL